MTRKITEETSLKLAVRDYLSWKGIFSYHIQQGLGSFPGLPDRVMHQDGVIYLEIKKPNGKMSEAQLQFQEQCKQDGISYHIIRELDDIIRIIERKPQRLKVKKKVNH